MVIKTIINYPPWIVRIQLNAYCIRQEFYGDECSICPGPALVDHGIMEYNCWVNLLRAPLHDVIVNKVIVCRIVLLFNPLRDIVILGQRTIDKCFNDQMEWRRNCLSCWIIIPLFAQCTCDINVIDIYLGIVSQSIFNHLFCCTRRVAQVYGIL